MRRSPLAASAVAANPPADTRGLYPQGRKHAHPAHHGRSTAHKAYLDVRKPCSAAIIGEGFIGLEMAENLRRLGIQVTVLERLAAGGAGAGCRYSRAAGSAPAKSGMAVHTGAVVEAITPAGTCLADSETV